MMKQELQIMKSLILYNERNRDMNAIEIKNYQKVFDILTYLEDGTVVYMKELNRNIKPYYFKFSWYG